MAQIATERPEQPTTVAPAIANPAPLGLSGFALTTFVLSMLNAGLFKSPGIVIGLALFYGGLVQLLAGIQEFRTGNTFGATAFCSYGGFWLSIGVLFTPSFNATTSPDFRIALAWYLLGWTIFTGWMFLGTLRANLALMSVFLLLFVTYLLLALAQFLNISILTTIGGWVGVATAAAAWYTAFAGVLASTRSAFKLPVFPIP